MMTKSESLSEQMYGTPPQGSIRALFRKLYLNRLYNPFYFPLRLIFMKNGFLYEEGWYKSVLLMDSVNKAGSYIPWYNYSVVSFLEERLQKSFRVFEYGAGRSTLWLSSRVKEVISVENSPEWVGCLMNQGLPSNVTIIKRERKDDYTQEISNHGQFDLIIIDGRWRPFCFEACQVALKPESVVIWDNSDRPDFQDMKGSLRDRGFKEIAIRGLAPESYLSTTTSILYNSHNCFDI